jgi:hypothetical protein
MLERFYLVRKRYITSGVYDTHQLDGYYEREIDAENDKRYLEMRNPISEYIYEVRREQEFE